MLAPQDATDNLRDFCKNPWDSEAFSQLSFQSRIRFLEEVYRYQREGGEAKVPPFLADLLKEIYEIPGMEGGTPVPVHIMFAKFHSDVGSDYRTKLGKTGELRVLGEEGWRDAFPAEEEYFLPLVEDEEKVGL